MGTAAAPRMPTLDLQPLPFYRKLLRLPAPRQQHARRARSLQKRCERPHARPRPIAPPKSTSRSLIRPIRKCWSRSAHCCAVYVCRTCVTLVPGCLDTAACFTHLFRRCPDLAVSIALTHSTHPAVLEPLCSCLRLSPVVCSRHPCALLLLPGVWDGSRAARASKARVRSQYRAATERARRWRRARARMARWRRGSSRTSPPRREADRSCRRQPAPQPSRRASHRLGVDGRVSCTPAGLRARRDGAQASSRPGGRERTAVGLLVRTRGR